MPIHSPTKALGPALVIVIAVVLGACSSTTYGTGTTPAAQTVEDLSGILAMGGKKAGEEPVVYAPRAPIVEPPATSLPPPGSVSTAALTSDWPTDPDEERKRLDTLVDERTAAGQSLKFSVPKEGGRTRPDMTKDSDRPFSQQVLKEQMRGSQLTPEQKKIFADAKQAKIGSFDENGNPVRRYLTEPPVEYREPDPESPVEISEKPKKKNKFKWPDLWPF